MPQNSSISASKAVKYFITILVTVLVLCALNIALTKYNISEEKLMPQDALYDYQIKKLKAANDIHTLFLGDSSLGNSINEKLWSELSGFETVNLALTAAYGYEGAYVMLNNVLGLGHKPKNLFIFYEPYQITNAPSYHAFLQSNPVITKDGVPLFEKLKLYWTMYFNKQSIFFNIKKLSFDRNVLKGEIEFENNYMKQQPSKRESGRFIENTKYTRTVNDINPRKFVYLKKIHEMCEKNSINCTYVIGPNVIHLCKKQGDLIEFQSQFIKESGFKIAENAILCPPSEDMGDSPNHIQPEMINVYTKKYFELLREYLN